MPTVVNSEEDACCLAELRHRMSIEARIECHCEGRTAARSVRSCGVDFDEISFLSAPPPLGSGGSEKCRIV